MISKSLLNYKMDLYDEFGNYVGPSLDDDEDDEQSDYDNEDEDRFRYAEDDEQALVSGNNFA